MSNTPAYPKKLPIVLIATLATLLLTSGAIVTGELLRMTAPRAATAVRSPAPARTPARAPVVEAVAEPEPEVEPEPAPELQPEPVFSEGTAEAVTAVGEVGAAGG